MTDTSAIVTIARRLNRLHRLSTSLASEVAVLQRELEAEARRTAGVPDEVFQAVSRVTGVSVAEIVGQSRGAHKVRARAIVCLVLQRSNLSYCAIARCLGKNHATIMHACRKAHEYMRTDPQAEMLRRAYTEGLAAWGSGVIDQMKATPPSP